MTPQPITPIGVTNHQQKELRFGIKDNDRMGHVYCVGKTGTGKSTLLLNMAISDIQRGNGVGVIDPHGDLAKTILEYVPPERVKDVIYFNVTDRNNAVSFNPLYNIAEQNRFLVASNLVSVFKKTWPDSWGPRLEHILRFSLFSLLYYPHASLLDLQPLLTNSIFRQSVLSHITEQSILEFWNKEFDPLSPQLKNEYISSILNKIGILSANTIIKHIIGRRISAFTIGEAMNKRQIFIANLSKGYAGEAGTAFLGSLLVTLFQTASLERARLHLPNRVPFYLYIDEAHSFITTSFIDILSESRKYGLSLFLTHQFLDQMQEDIFKAIIGNIGTLICFRVGSHDALLLEQEFYPIFSKEDLLRLPQYHIYLKLLIDGTQSPPFSARTCLTNTHKYSLGRMCIGKSRRRYTMPVEEGTLMPKLIYRETKKPNEASNKYKTQEPLF